MVTCEIHVVTTELYLLHLKDARKSFFSQTSKAETWLTFSEFDVILAICMATAGSRNRAII